MGHLARDGQERGLALLAHVCKPLGYDGGLSDRAIDLVADLMHAERARGRDPDNLLKKAAEQYKSELEDGE